MIKYALLVVLTAMSVTRVAVAQDPAWSVNPNEFAGSMSVTSVVVIGGSEAVNPDDRVGAFVNGQVRGVTQPIQVGSRWFFFVTVFGQANGERISFRLYRSVTNEVNAIFETATFSIDAILGNTATPFLLTADVATGVETDVRVAATLGGNYPEPFTDQTTIPYSLSEPGHVELAVYNVLGQRVGTVVDANRTVGAQTASFDASGLPDGVYIYRLRTRSSDETRTMVLAR